MTQPDWAEIIAQMTPEQQQEVRRIADKMTKCILEWKPIPSTSRKPGEPIRFRQFNKETGG